MSKPFRQQLPGVFRKYIPHLDVKILVRLTGNPTERGINHFDASLLQYFPKEQQFEIWNMVKHKREPTIRFHIIRKILAHMRIEIQLGAGIIKKPSNPTLTSPEEVAELIENVI